MTPYHLNLHLPLYNLLEITYVAELEMFAHSINLLIQQYYLNHQKHLQANVCNVNFYWLNWWIFWVDLFVQWILRVDVTFQSYHLFENHQLMVRVPCDCPLVCNTFLSWTNKYQFHLLNTLSMVMWIESIIVPFHTFSYFPFVQLVKTLDIDFCWF